jgi:hypothetical protein
MKKIGTVSYNIYCNFTNYGSALQTWALHQAIKKFDGFQPVLVDYCPDILADKDPLNPFSNMWDRDEESRRMCELTMPAIRENYRKFDTFYKTRFDRTSQNYSAGNFDEISKEKLDGYVCGSDTIFCPDEFGVDDGYFANYYPMQGHSVAFAASFGDPTMTVEVSKQINERLRNFKAIGLRENLMIPYVKRQTEAPVQKVIDPTLLLTPEEYESITEDRIIEDKYLLLYSRRYSPEMEAYAEKVAKENGWKIVEISLRATNADKGHIMFYRAGVEEFLSLVKNAEFVVTNSFHGMILSVQMKKQFAGFSRDQCNSKIDELLSLLGLKDRLYVTGKEQYSDIDYDAVHKRIAIERNNSVEFLKCSLNLL